MRITGYAAVFDSPSVDLGGFVETIAPGAFADSIRNEDVVLLHGHDSGRPLGRQSAGNLSLTEDDKGLRFSVELPDTPGARELHGLVRGEIMNAMSFGFSIPSARDEEWSEDRDGNLRRTLRRVKLMEISPVTFPAYPSTTVEARGKVPTKGSKGSSNKTIGSGKARSMRKTMKERLRQRDELYEFRSVFATPWR